MRRAIGCNVAGMKFVGCVVSVAAATGIASLTYQQIAEARDRRRFPPPGRLVDIGGHRLHLVDAGHGSPTVVIIPALANDVLQWLGMLDGAAAETHVCVYDRAGIGWSDAPPRGRHTPGTMASDLHALLQAADIPPPYILIGHSLGGVIGRRFQADYPQLVAGMLLIDSAHEDHARRLGALDWREGPLGILKAAARSQARILGARRLAVAFGLAPGFDADIARTAPPQYAGAARAIRLSARQKHARVRELLVLAQSWGPPRSLGSLPLTVLTASPRPWRGWPVWAQLQDELVALSSDSVHIKAEKSGHDVQRDNPDLVIQAIRNLLERCGERRRAGRSEGS